MRKYANILLTAVLTVPLTCTASMATADGDVAVSKQGLLPDGTPYSLSVPEEWNGITIVMPGRAVLTGEVPEWLSQQGYGVIGYRLSNDWDLAQDRDNASSAVALFAETAGEPETVIVSGRSQGGLTTRIITESNPDWLDGAVPMCGGGAGAISMWNAKLDTAFALRELIDPDSELAITRIKDEQKEHAAVNALVASATASQEGKARIVLAAALSKIPAVDATTGQDIPETDLEARTAKYAGALPLALGSAVRAGFERTIGGAFSWNNGVNYEEALKESGRWAEVQRAYREAGLDLDADLVKLAEAPRISADVEAVQVVEKLATFTGNLEVPVLSLHTTGDPAGPTSDETAYADVVRASGDNQNLRQTFAAANGHCTFTPAEQIAAIETMAHRIADGRWPSTSAPALAQTAMKAQGATTLPLEQTRFTNPQPAQPARPWDARDWGTYLPAQ